MPDEAVGSMPRALTYPTARRVEQTDDYFGTAVADPYRWMEEVDSAEVKAWVTAQNVLTEEWLGAVTEREAMRARLLALTDYERFSAPTRRGTRYFQSRNSGLQNQPVLFWQEGLEGEPQVLLDPNTLSADGTVALSGVGIAENGTLMAYATSDAGSDWVTWRVRMVATGEDLADVVEWSKFSGASWLRDLSGFFYQGYERPGEIARDASLKTANYFHKVYFHRLGTAQTEDTVVFERPDDRELNMGAGVTQDGRYLVIQQSRGTSPNNQIAILDLEDPGAGAVSLVSTEEAVFDLIANEGSVFWFRTTLNAPKSKVIAIDLSHPERSAWKTIVPEAEFALDGVAMVHDLFLAQYLQDAQSYVEMRSKDGALLGTVELPAIGTATGFGGRRTDAETFFTFTNFTTPGTIYRLDLATRTTSLYRQPKLAFDPGRFVTEQVFFPSKDGTRVPMFLTSRRGLVRDGGNPTLLYGYGGFNVTLQPAFSPSYILWMEMGGVYAQAGLRGGGEYGEAWHAAGMKRNKQNVFDDFLAAAEWLIATGYTRPGRLAIEGGSNGGLLVGACVLQRPELFGAAISQVGVLDMLRFDRFTIGWAWKADYGSPSEVEDEFRAIYAYSPLHNVKPGRAYPPTLMTTGDHDDRVFPAHSYKFTAALQAAQAGAHPILIRVETRAGHGGGMPLSKRVELTTDTYAFLIRALEMEAAEV